MLEKYLKQTEFSSYEDMIKNFEFVIPENFNFGFDVVDEWAREEPKKRALVWCNPEGDEKELTFTDISRMSNQTANMLKSLGLKKGDVAMLLLKRRWEYWVIAPACHKLGVTIVPVNHLMKKKDLIYRINKVNVTTVICVNEEMAIAELERALESCPQVNVKIVVQDRRPGWIFYNEEYQKHSDVFERPTGPDATTNDDTMLMYYTSGTTGMPKVVCHNYLYPIGHIVTGCYWHKVVNNGLHLTIADTGWAKEN